MEHKITPRQLEALVACYCGQRTYDEPSGIYGEQHPKAGEPYWRRRTNMGGAVHRMADDLRERGYITEFNRYEDFGDKTSDDLTAIGYAALAERLGKLPTIKNSRGEVIYRFEIDLKELRDRQEARMQREAEIERKRAEKREADRETAERWRLSARAKLLARFRQLLKDYGIADNWSDEQVLQFAEQAGDAIHAA